MARKPSPVTIRILILLSAISLVIGLIVLLVGVGEPQYEGRSLTSWLDQTQSVYSHCADAEHPELDPEWLECQTAVKNMGSRTFPFLLAWTRSKDSDTKIKIIRWLNRHPAFHLESHPEPAIQRHVRAIHGFNLLGKQAAPVLPKLVEMTRDKARDRRYWGYMSLVSTRPASEILEPVVTRLLTDSDSEIRITVAETFFGLYPEEAKRIGVCEQFPDICYPTNTAVHRH